MHLGKYSSSEKLPHTLAGGTFRPDPLRSDSERLDNHAPRLPAMPAIYPLTFRVR
jgi:hypothetical protein